jgi:hypothetical protein
VEWLRVYVMSSNSVPKGRKGGREGRREEGRKERGKEMIKKKF